jgi:hypothetical protein
LDLINKYPELAGLVENKDGVLTIDLEDESVQNILAEYEKNKIYAQGASIGAKNNLART